MIFFFLFISSNSVRCRGFNHDDRWGHRAGEPNKAVICSLALAKLRTDIRGDMTNSNAVGMAQKLLLFWRKPARRCWWEGVELENVEGVEGKLKVWIRRVWTLEMVCFDQICLCPPLFDIEKSHRLTRPKCTECYRPPLIKSKRKRKIADSIFRLISAYNQPVPVQP